VTDQFPCVSEISEESVIAGQPASTNIMVASSNRQSREGGVCILFAPMRGYSGKQRVSRLGVLYRHFSGEVDVTKYLW